MMQWQHDRLEHPHRIEAYGNAAIRVGGQEHEGPLLLTPQICQTWGPANLEALTQASFLEVAARDSFEIFLWGTGERGYPLDPAWIEALAKKNISIESMTTPSACRTYNILLLDGRRAAAWLWL